MSYFAYYISVVLFSQFTLSVCVWRWSCDSLQGADVVTGDAEDA